MASFLEWGNAKTPQNVARTHKRALVRALRELEQARQGLVKQERTTLAEIKHEASLGHDAAVRSMARDVVRSRNACAKFVQMRTQLKSVQQRIDVMRSSHAMAEAMRGATRAMFLMNRQINLPGLQAIMTAFAQQSETMDMKQEMMDTAIDGATEQESDAAQEETLVSQVLDEIGIKLQSQLGDAPRGEMPATATAESKKAAAAVPLAAGDTDLQSRLDRLTGNRGAD